MLALQTAMRKFSEPFLIVGARGMLGTHLVRLFQESGSVPIAVDIEEVDITNADSVMNLFDRAKPKTVINCAAIADVDGCESAAEAAFNVNARGVENLARASLQFRSMLVHISTDYVFDGLKGSPYVEDDPMNPLGVYGASKAAGETHVREIVPETHCIVRTQWLFGLYGKNFVEAILGLAQKQDVLRVVDDQFGSPTYAHDLAASLIELCGLGALGTFHVTNSGSTTWHGFASAILQRAGMDHVQVESMSTSELDRPAPRPLYSVLDNSLYVGLAGSPLRSWEAALDEYLQRRKEGS
jgi:dTDP-4-dehydrorhamnose reductase